jgi:hypothetical protein
MDEEFKKELKILMRKLVDCQACAMEMGLDKEDFDKLSHDSWVVGKRYQELLKANS